MRLHIQLFGLDLLDIDWTTSEPDEEPEPVRIGFGSHIERSEDGD